MGRADHTVFAVILAISFCHLLNDMMQSLLPAIYPNLKADFGLSFGQIGLVSLVYQLTASILQPLVGLYADRRPTPLALPGGTLFSLAGLVVLSVAHSYTVLLIGASLLGVGSSVFHPESSRVARMAAGGRHGLAQSLFQVGGNAGQALGPLAQHGQPRQPQRLYARAIRAAHPYELAAVGVDQCPVIRVHAVEVGHDRVHIDGLGLLE